MSVNSPDRDDAAGGAGLKLGTVGRPIPGVAAKVVDLTTGRDVQCGTPGLLLVNGPGLMTEYLNEPERTAEVVRNGWYVTGDVAAIDPDGFIRITDRISRFSKIAGEMVPHVKIEDTLNSILGEHAAVVTSVPDPQKGERIVAFYAADQPPEFVWDRLCRSDLPRLWLPRREHLYRIEAIPQLGTGKIDLRSIRKLALERASEPSRTAVQSIV